MEEDDDEPVPARAAPVVGPAFMPVPPPRLDYAKVPIRNVQPSPDGSGRFDCEIDHPELGWIPFTADPDDEWEYARVVFHRIKRRG